MLILGKRGQGIVFFFLSLFSRSVVSNSLQSQGLQHPGFPVLHYLLELAQTPVHWVGDAIQPSHPLSSASSPALHLSQHQGLASESALHIRWPKYWSFSFSISPSNEYSGLISFRMDWFDLLAVQGTLKSLLQHHFASGRGRKKFLMEAEWVCSKGPLTGRAGYQVTLVQLWPGLHLCLDLT